MPYAEDPTRRSPPPRSGIIAAVVVLALASACSVAGTGSAPPPPGTTPATATAASAPTTPPAPGGPVGNESSRSPAPARAPEVRTVRGIDLSHHQGDPDWAQVRRGGVEFAYLKATEGSTFTDPEVVQRWSSASEAGLRVGAYHYYALCSPPLPQAEHFLGLLDTLSPARRSLPPVVDVELIGACDDPPARSELLAGVRTWIDRVEESTGERVVVYLHPDLEARYRISDDLVQDAARDRWVRRIGDQAPPAGRWWIWQRDDDASVPGVPGPVDLDVMRVPRGS